MSKRNPFRVMEKIGNIALGVLLAAVVALALSALVVSCIREGWGWWTLLLIPGIPIGLLVLVVIAGLIGGLTYTIGNRWQSAKGRWDYRNREVVRTADIFDAKPTESDPALSPEPNHPKGSGQ